ncbi:MAG: glycosyltransferase family 9 protein [Sedimentisphaerales bacterium]|nr:glycosyltransferase family 9 protein [Sedimentisphaerales bacterium]
MQAETDILALLEAKGAQVAKEAQRAVILQPGALGDCVLTLPLVRIMKEGLNLGGVDIIGHTEYIGAFPGRTCVDGVRSIDSAELHRMFVEPAKFDLVDWDPLINTFAAYSWIVTFLGEPGSHFEQNLIFTANCSHSAEIITLSMKPPEDSKCHVADFYVEQFAGQSSLPAEQANIAMNEVLIRVTEADRDCGVELLDQAEIDLSRKLIVLHPGSGGRGKCWHLENFVSLAEDLQAQGLEVVFLLGPAEMERLCPADEAHLYGAARCVGHLSLAQVVGLLSCADAFVGNDSGVSHLAAGMGLRTYVVFGPTDPVLYRPIGPAVTVFQDAQKTFAERPSPDFQKQVFAAVASIA